MLFVVEYRVQGQFCAAVASPNDPFALDLLIIECTE